MGQTIYSFSIAEPKVGLMTSGIIVAIGSIILLVISIMLLFEEKNPWYLSGTIICIAFSFVLLAIATSNEEHYSIMKIETFADFEKVTKENKSVQMIDDNVFLAKLKEKK